MLPVALLTATEAPWKWQFVLLYLAAGFVLDLFVRPRSQDRQTLIHVLVLGGSAPIAVRFFFGNELGILGTVHVGAVLAASTGFGYLLADSVRARQLTDRHTG